jgi:glycosyltransferase involved in cell wall biosynthesis
MDLKLSVIVPVFNAKKFIFQFDSLNITRLSRRFSDDANFELVFMDGDSTDGTTQQLTQISEHHSFVKVYSSKDLGIYDAMNKGVAKVKSKFVFFLGIDDVITDGFFDLLSELDDSYDILYGNVTLTSNNEIYNREFTFDDLVVKNVCHQACFYRRLLLLENPYELKYKFLSDWASNLLFCKIAKVKYFDKNVCVYNDVDGASSSLVDIDFKNDRLGLVKKYFGWMGVFKFIYLILLYKIRK